MKYSIFAWAIVAVVVGIVIFLPIQVPYSISAYGRIVPAQRWILMKGNDGQLTTSQYNFETGQSEGYSTTQFARESAVRFTLLPSIIGRGVVEAGDTVGTIISTETTVRLAELRGQLSVARASLQAALTGEKEAVIAECRQKLEWAEGQKTYKAKELARQKALVSKNLISLEEYEAAVSEVALLDIKVDIAASGLKAAVTGAKPEEIVTLRSQTIALENEISAMQRRIETFTITAPFGGKQSPLSVSDTLVIVNDTSSLIAFIPILMKDCDQAIPGQAVSIKPLGYSNPIKASLISIGSEAHIVNGREVLLGIAKTTGLPGKASLGMMANCTIHCEPVTLYEYFQRILTKAML